MNKAEFKSGLRFKEFEDECAWEEKTLGEICEITNGKANVQDHVENGIYPLFDRSETVKASNEFIFDTETVIIPGEGMQFIPKYFKGRFNLHQRAYALKDFNCIGKFVYQYMLHRSELLSQKAVQSTVLSLRLPILLKFPIQIPKNQIEQQKIASCLSSIDDLITAETDYLNSLQNHKKGLMQKLFPKTGEKVPALRYKEFEGDGEWIKALVSNYFKDLSTGMTPSREVPEYFMGNIPWITSGELNFNTIEVTKETISEVAVKDTNLRIYPKGTFFIAITGLEAPGTRGKCAINGVPATTNQSCMAFTQSNEIDTLFLFYWYRRFSEELYRFSQGTKQQSFNNAIVEKFVLVHPKLAEQQKIAACLSSLDALISTQTEKIEQLKLHKKGLMQGLFPKVD